MTSTDSTGTDSPLIDGADKQGDRVAPKQVRLAWADDAFGIGAVQYAAWQQQLSPLVDGDLLATVDADAFALAWESSLASPPSARHRVLVALDGKDVVGFAALAPSEDPDADPTVGEVLAMHVHPDREGAGHGSRLLTAAVDTLRSDGFATATVWVIAHDDRTAGFLASAGWAADGSRREVASDSGPEGHVAQARWHVGLHHESE